MIPAISNLPITYTSQTKSKKNNSILPKTLGVVGSVGLGSILGLNYGSRKLPMVLSQEYLSQMNDDLMKQTKNLIGQVADLKNEAMLWKNEGIFHEAVRTLLAPLVNETSKPNCICIHGGEVADREELIQYIKDFFKRPDCKDHHYITITKDDDIVEYIEQGKKYFEETKKHTVLEVKGMEDLISHKKGTDHTIGAMKSIMGDCSKYFKTTLLFTTQNPEELDKIAMADHRVKRLGFDINQEKINNLEEEIANLDKEMRGRVDDAIKAHTKKIKKMKFKWSLIGGGIGLLVAGVGLLIVNNKQNKNEKLNIKV